MPSELLRRPLRPRLSAPKRRHVELWAIAWLALTASACGKRGDPLPPLRRVPQPVVALAVSQRGALVVVSYQAPRTTTDGQRLPVLEVELLRADRDGELAKVGTRSLRKVAPAELIVVTEPAPAPGTVLRFGALARSKKQVSTLASAPPLVVVEPPSRPANVVVTPAAIGARLTWTAPPDAVGPSFWVYRRAQALTYARPLNTAPVIDPAYDDTTATLGENWCYVVRRVVSAMPVIESAPSAEVCVQLRDLTPPAAPLGAATLVAPDGNVTLSWSPSPESDLAFYRIYRGRDRQERVAELPPTETRWRDPLAGARRQYVISAVDQAGNESEPCPPVEARTP